MSPLTTRWWPAIGADENMLQRIAQRFGIHVSELTSLQIANFEGLTDGIRSVNKYAATIDNENNLRGIAARDGTYMAFGPNDVPAFFCKDRRILTFPKNVEELKDLELFALGQPDWHRNVMCTARIAPGDGGTLKYSRIERAPWREDVIVYDLHGNACWHSIVVKTYRGLERVVIAGNDTAKLVTAKTGGQLATTTADVLVTACCSGQKSSDAGLRFIQEYQRIHRNHTVYMFNTGHAEPVPPSDREGKSRLELIYDWKRESYGIDLKNRNIPTIVRYPAPGH